MSRGGIGAFDAIGGRDASSGRKKDHLKSDLFGRETHNTQASTVPAPAAAKALYDANGDSKDRTHQVNIRPFPSTLCVLQKLIYGLCIETWTDASIRLVWQRDA